MKLPELPEEVERKLEMLPGPPSSPISRDDRWQLRKETKAWRLAVIALASFSTGLLGALITILILH